MRARSSVLALCIALGCGREVFACKQTADCGDAGACEPDGWCSFPDDACASGRRYGHWVGDGLADHCVPSGVADTGSSTGTTTSTTTGVESSSGGAESTAMITTSASSEDGPASTSFDPTTEGSSSGEPVSDLVAWYRFEEVAFDGVVLDSANGHDGSCDRATCPISTPGVVGNAARFDGVDDIVIVANHPDFATDTGFTLAAWVAIDPMQPGFICIVAKPLDDTDDRDTWELGRQQEGQATTNVSLSDGAYAVATAEELLTSEWTHLASTWDGATLLLYVSGVQVASIAAPELLITEHDLNFGASWDLGAPGDFLLGGIDELQIWRRALTADEIAMMASP